MKTIFCDIDGTLLYHHSDGLSGQCAHTAQILPGVIEKINEWQANGFTIVLTTGRRESQRRQTEAQLQDLGVFWDHMVMGLPSGERIIINDLKPGKKMSHLSDKKNRTAQAICVERNVGIEGVEI
jgi:ribonucleotide monophosphatase NagD (HAD superfamily)